MSKKWNETLWRAVNSNDMSHDQAQLLTQRLATAKALFAQHNIPDGFYAPIAGGDCLEHCQRFLRYLINKPGWLLVQATAGLVQVGEIRGEYQHTWIEHKGLVFDFTEVQKFQPFVGVPFGWYYRGKQWQVVKKFNGDEFRSLAFGVSPPKFTFWL